VLPYEEVPDKPANDAATIYRENTKRIRTADAVVADISPFRGPHMDVGRAMEIGYAAALGKPVLEAMVLPLGLPRPF
jgi:nucleoside 2-deoxyribosyltransferase